VKKKKRIVITGIGPLSSLGIGKKDFWQGVLKKRQKIKREKVSIEGEFWDQYYLHRLDDFNIDKFNCDKRVLKEIAQWKNNEKVTDLYYLMAAAKLSLEDSKLNCEEESTSVGLVLTHENPGMNQFAEKVVSISFDLIKNTDGSLEE